MNQKEVLEQITAGKPVVIGEFRRAIAKIVKRREIKAGQSATMGMITMQIEIDNTQAEVATFVDDDKLTTFHPEQYIPPFKKGDAIVILLKSLNSVNFKLQVNGEVFPYLPTAADAAKPAGESLKR